MKPVMYSAAIIEQFANRLYERADAIVRWYQFLFGILGFSVGLIFGVVVGIGIEYVINPRFSDDPTQVFAVTSAIFSVSFAIMFVRHGRKAGELAAFKYRLQAQQALCQVEIERNGRVAEGQRTLSTEAIVAPRKSSRREPTLSAA